MPIVLHGPNPSVYDTSNRKPHVIIIGAGLAGLTLAVLLQKAGIPYDVFEKSPETRNVAGGALYLTPNLGPLFTQMGIMDEYLAKSKRCSTIRLFNENREQDFALDFSLTEELSGFEGRLIPRKVLYEIILSKVPSERLHRAKRMSWMTQGENGVHVKFTDGTEFEGDILVGADGAFSAVRKCLYDRLQKDHKLPPSDAKDLPFSCVSVAGYTGPLDPEKFTLLKNVESDVVNTRSFDKPYSWNLFAVKDNKMCWSSTLYLDAESSKFHNNFRTTDWGEEGAEGMCNDIRDFPIVGGDGTLTLGDLIDNTPKDQMAKVMLEEKVFDTWHHCRTVLIGDGKSRFPCHKLHPAGGQGATYAFHDAVALANWINVLPTTQVKDLEKAFKSYRDERHAAALMAEAHAKNMCKFYGQATDRAATFTRFIFKNMPFWLWTFMMKKHIGCRPQASFLPPVPNTGTIPPVDLPSYCETLKVVKAREAVEAEKAAQNVDVQAGAEIDAVPL
ncbi:MAG: hypothetical protein JOS17DRAFT_789210 [Linnemannia elongata]|nr:MAG: hypothetical protein JOS17DRAFT_789210 [Linnemannia elongata]